MNSIFRKIISLSPQNWVFAILTGIALGFMVSKMGIIGPVLLIGLPAVIVYLYLMAVELRIGIYSIISMAFLIPFLSRYYPIAPFGLAIDGFLFFMWIVLFFRYFKDLDLSMANNSLSIWWAVWMLYVFLMIGNPLVRSYVAWFYAMRGLALYSFLITPLAFLVFNRRQDMENFFILVMIFEMIGTLWGAKQLLIGVSLTEQRWLDAGADLTHVLFGRLRVFSYFTDAAQFGASQAHVALISLIFSLANTGWKKWFYTLGALLSIYGMLISGSRAPIAIPAVGGLVFLIMSRKYVLLAIGMFMGGSVFGFLKFTTIMQSNYQINRLRTSLNPSEDPSFLVRKHREERLSKYLANKPIGEGVGCAGFWGKRFLPGTFLAEIGTDGHYTRIWMETGIIGLWIYLAMFGTFAYKGTVITWNIRDDDLRLKMSAISGSFYGLLLASYTNGLIIQLPTGFIFYLSFVFLYLSPGWDDEIAEEKRIALEAEENKKQQILLDN